MHEKNCESKKYWIKQSNIDSAKFVIVHSELEEIMINLLKSQTHHFWLTNNLETFSLLFSRI